MKGWILIATMMIVAGCAKQRDDISVSADKRIYIIGHAGNGFSGYNEYPPNSMAAVKRAIQYYNADGVEVDIRLSSDSVLFMFHDPVLDYTTTCTGCFSGYNAATLRDCRFRSVHGNLPAEAIAPLEEVFQLAAARKVKPSLFLDVHFNSPCTDNVTEAFYARILEAVNKLLIRYNSFDHTLIESTNVELLAYAHRHYPAIKTVFDIADIAQINTASEHGIYAIGADHKLLKPAEIAKAHTYGLKVMLWGAGTKNELVDAFNSAPDYYLAEDLQLVQNMQ